MNKISREDPVFFLCRLNDNGAYKIQILARKIGSLNCSLLFQRNGKGTTVPLFRNEERNAFFFSNLERRTERVPFFRKERGTERVPEIRGTTKALYFILLNPILSNFERFDSICNNSIPQNTRNFSTNLPLKIPTTFRNPCNKEPFNFSPRILNF